MTPTERKPESSPGPWRVTEGENGLIVRATDSTGKPIASMWLNGDDPKANADLICRAVNSHPELVRALEETAKRWDGTADQLERWANESLSGGWSTHQVEANRAEAEYCRANARNARRALLSSRSRP
ncbi:MULTISPECIES: hypothetical protein [unclassified Bradyrhizobium]